MNLSFLRAGVFAFACGGALLASAQSASAACEGGAPNSILQPSEACDDGNATGGDGCSAMCLVEEGWTCDRPVTFTGLRIENYPTGNANWNISANGQQGTQTVNSSHGTFAMMGARSGAGTYTFQISVANNETDDDFIGFALGFSQGEAATAGIAADYLLLDWKRGDQVDQNVMGRKGIAVSHVSGTTKPTVPNLWGHLGPVAEIYREGAYGNVGWALGTVYTFKITYTTDSLRVYINDNLAVDMDVNDPRWTARFPAGFPAGEIAFYGFSQPQVTYKVLGPFGASKCNRPPVIDPGNPPEPVDNGGGGFTIDLGGGFTDQDGNPLDPDSVRVVETNPNTTVVVDDNGNATVTPTTPGGSQDLEFTYEVCDTHPTIPLCVQGDIHIHIPPTASDDTARGIAGETLDIPATDLTANDNNVNHDLYDLYIEGEAENLSAFYDPETGIVTVVPHSDEVTEGYFTYVLVSRQDPTKLAPARVDVTFNRKPNAQTLWSCVAVDTDTISVDVASGFVDPDGHNFGRVITPELESGTFAAQGSGLLGYSPVDPSLAGIFEFLIQVCDDDSVQACEKSTWNVVINDAPTLMSPLVQVAPGGTTATLAPIQLVEDLGEVELGQLSMGIYNPETNSYGLSLENPFFSVTLSNQGLVVTGLAEGSSSFDVRVCELCGTVSDAAACTTTTIRLSITSCVVDGDCASGRCHPESFQCVPCLGDSDCSAGDVCAADNTCVGCLDTSVAGSIDAGCDAASPVCEVASGDCFGCLADSDCANGTLCTTDRVCSLCEDTASGSAADRGCSITNPVCVDGNSCASVCGDGVVASDERCDDGNSVSDDGCSASCQPEHGFTCGEDGCQASCGDGLKASNEGCDDGNAVDGDGCSAACSVESGYDCTTEGELCAPICGDGIIAGEESCDDSNTDAGDGCSESCTTEHGFTCEGLPSACESTCGDGLKASDEACDDSNTEAGDGCSAACDIEPGFACDSEPSNCTPGCGDGIVAGAEGCDDGNLEGADGCSETCQPEHGFDCEGAPSACASVCGDGFIASDEACDDGNAVDGDGCSATCEVEAGFNCDEEPSRCVTGCGDGIIAGDESCDDGNAESGDGCSALCEVEDGFGCEGAPSECALLCGNGIIGEGEGCDDGNMVSGDGCSATCQVESNFLCDGEPSVCTVNEDNYSAHGAGSCAGGSAAGFGALALAGLILARRRRLAA